MIRTIGKENLKNDTIMYQNKFDYCNLIIGSEGVNFFKIGDKIIYDRNGLNSLDNDEFSEEYNFNELYLSFTASNTGHNFQTNYFLKGMNTSLFVSKPIYTDEQTSKENYFVINKNELEHLFDNDYFDSMFLIHRNGNCEFGYDKKTGIEYKTKLNLEPKDDSNIIYGPNKFGKYSHFLITSFNNQFYVVWFKLELLSENEYKLTTYPIEILDLDLKKTTVEASKYIKEFIPDESVSRKRIKN